MKTILLGSLLLSSTAFAQNLDMSGLKSLMTSKQATLEKVNAGMTKKVVTTGVIKLDDGVCGYMITAVQSILKIDGDKIIVLSKEKFSPQNNAACRASGNTASVEATLLYFDKKPTLSEDLADMDASAADISNIVRSGDIVTMDLKVSETEKAVIKYDFSKPSFKNLILSQSSENKTVTEEMIDIDVKKVDLTKVLLCDDSDGDNSECVEGNYSDILYN